MSLDSALTQPAGRADSISRRSPLPLLCVLTATAVAAGRMFMLVNRYAVNIFFWDQWDFNNATLFEKHSLWQMFTWQHGPHRQGLGALISFILEPLFRWNSRGEAFLASTIFLIAALLAVYLKKRLYGTLSYLDAVIPLLFLTPLEYEAWFGSTNLAHGPLPILLLIIYCIGLTAERLAARYALVLIVNFLTIYTGFGIFVGVITPLLLVIDYYRNSRAGAGRSTIPVTLAALLIAVGSLASFFVGYRFDPAAACFRPFSEPLSQYLRYVDLMFVSFTGMKGAGAVPTLLGGMILFWSGVALIGALLGSLRNRDKSDAQGMVAAVLLFFSFLFCVNAAVGRLCLGLLTAQSSRYVPYLIPAFLGIYFFCLSCRWKTFKTVGLFAVLAIAISAALPVRIGDRSMMEQYHNVKNNWRQCYLQRHDIQQCDLLTGAKIYPWLNSGLSEKLVFLEEKKLNLYSTRE